MEINILQIESSTDQEYGKSIVKYSIPKKNFVSYIFSKQDPNNFVIGKAEKEIKEHIKSEGGITSFPVWSEMSDTLRNLVDESCFDMKFVELDDEDWTLTEAEKILAETQKWKALDSVITPGNDDDCYLIIYAGAVCCVNWYDHKLWG